MPEQTEQGQLRLPTTDEEIAAAVENLLPAGPGRRRSLETRRKEARQLLRLAASAAADKRTAEERDTRKGDELATARNRYEQLRYFTLLSMTTYAQLTLENGAMPAGLLLQHPSGASVEATFLLGDVPATLGPKGLDLDHGKFRLRVESKGLEGPQAEAVGAYLAARRAQGATSDEDLARKLLKLMREGKIGGITVASGCGECAACATLREQVAAADSIEKLVTALAFKGESPCPPGYGHRRHPDELYGIRVTFIPG